MPKLGVYVASYNQPVFLRHCLLQIAAQTRLPDVLSVHENANPRSYLNMVEDVLQILHDKGVTIRYKHSAYPYSMPLYFCWPIEKLIEEGAGLIQKIDVDDIIYTTHLQMQETLGEALSEDQHYALNPNSGLLVIPHNGSYRHNPSVDFSIWNPTGAHPNNIIFTHVLAKEFVVELGKHSLMNDDAVLAEFVMPNFKGLTVPGKPTSCFVAHGRNVSVAHWATTPPPEAGD
jgi:hypothetical protein